MRSDYFNMASRILSQAMRVKSLAHSICSVNVALQTSKPKNKNKNKQTVITQTLKSRGGNLLDELCGSYVLSHSPNLFARKGRGFQKEKQKAEPWHLRLLLLSLHGPLQPGTWQTGVSRENTDLPLLGKGLQSAATVTPALLSDRDLRKKPQATGDSGQAQ